MYQMPRELVKEMTPVMEDFPNQRWYLAKGSKVIFHLPYDWQEYVDSVMGLKLEGYRDVVREFLGELTSVDHNFKPLTSEELEMIHSHIGIGSWSRNIPVSIFG